MLCYSQLIINQMNEIINDGEKYYLRARMDNTLVYESASGGDAIVIVNTEIICTIRAISIGNVGMVDVMV